MSEQVQLVFLQTHIEDAHERLAVTGLEKRVEATDVVKESSDTEIAKGRVSLECGNCHYTTPTLRRSKATQKLRAHSRGCKVREGGQNKDNQAEL